MKGKGNLISGTFSLYTNSRVTGVNPDPNETSLTVNHIDPSSEASEPEQKKYDFDLVNVLNKNGEVRSHHSLRSFFVMVTTRLHENKLILLKIKELATTESPVRR